MGRQILLNGPGKGAGLGMRTGNEFPPALSERQAVFQLGPNERAIISSPLHSDLRFQCTDTLKFLNGQE
jgi:hypothetical protein